MANDTKAKVVIALTLQGASMLGRGLGLASKALNGVGSAIRKTNEFAFFFINNMKSLAGAVNNVASALIEPNAKFDDFIERMQFMGYSAAESKEKLRELFQAAGRMDLPTDDVRTMYLELQKFGQGGLATAENMKLVAEASKYAGTSAGTMADSIGELYQKLKMGKDFDRAAMSLMQMGLASGETLKKIGQLQEKGATFESIWGMVTKEIEESTRFVGQADRTWGDLTNRVQDFWTEGKRLVGQGLFAALKTDMEKGLNDLEAEFASGRMEKLGGQIGEVIRKGYEAVKEKTFGNDFNLKFLFDASEQGKLADVIDVIMKGAGTNLCVAVVNGFITYGPDIQRALTPKFLQRKLFGFTTAEEDAAMKNVGAGTASKADWEQLNYMQKLKLGLGGTAGYLGAGGRFAKQDVAEQGRLEGMQTYGQDYWGTHRPKYVNIGKGLASLGVKDEPLPPPPPSSNPYMMQVTTMKEMNANLYEAATQARILAERLERANQAATM